jgi:hypothetical protein
VGRFFDSYPAFYRTGYSTPPNRLAARHRALIEENRALIAGSSVLDIASHDGRWSFAALHAGAREVVGIEARPELVAAAEENFRAHGAGSYRFLTGDVHERIAEVASADVVFLFGFFYHTIHHALLLAQIRRLAPRALLIDSEVDPGVEAPTIRLREDDARNPLSAVSSDGERALVGLPSRSALDWLLKSAHFSPRYYDWQKAGITDWDAIEDYRDGKRVSLVATPV